MATAETNDESKPIVSEEMIDEESYASMDSFAPHSPQVS